MFAPIVQTFKYETFHFQLENMAEIWYSPKNVRVPCLCPRATAACFLGKCEQRPREQKLTFEAFDTEHKEEVSGPLGNLTSQLEKPQLLKCL